MEGPLPFPKGSYDSKSGRFILHAARAGAGMNSEERLIDNLARLEYGAWVTLARGRLTREWAQGDERRSIMRLAQQPPPEPPRQAPDMASLTSENVSMMLALLKVMSPSWSDTNAFLDDLQAHEWVVMQSRLKLLLHIHAEGAVDVWRTNAGIGYRDLEPRQKVLYVSRSEEVIKLARRHQYPALV